MKALGELKKNVVISVGGGGGDGVGERQDSFDFGDYDDEANTFACSEISTGNNIISRWVTSRNANEQAERESGFTFDADTHIRIDNPQPFHLMAFDTNNSDTNLGHVHDFRPGDRFGRPFARHIYDSTAIAGTARGDELVWFMFEIRHLHVGPGADHSYDVVVVGLGMRYGTVQLQILPEDENIGWVRYTPGWCGAHQDQALAFRTDGIPGPYWQP